MIRKLLLPTIVLILACGFWISPDFKVIAAGVAIFLFGMLSLEEGFRALAGGAMDRLLRLSTDSVWKSLSFGIVTTTLVQSSSLVSILTISFLSAGLITLAGGIGIIFGANLGTTTGAWLVAGFGLKVSLSDYAMPLLVFGVLLVFQTARTAKGLGYALVGLGFLLLGIDTMKQGFEAFKANIDLAAYAMPGLAGLLVFTAIGILATVVMQSSHATLVLILTALAAGQISYENALALAIGSNIGTTITAIIGSMSANVDGRRLAAAHLVFNLITGLTALVLIHPFMLAVDVLSEGVGIAADDFTLKLAVFHSLFNLVGILLMLPFIEPLERALQRFIKTRAALITQPAFLNEATVGFPEAAIEAVRNETSRLYDIAVKIIAHGVSLRSSAIFSDRDLGELVAASRKVIREDINEAYTLHVKALYSAIVEFISRARLSADERQSEDLHALRMAGSRIVEAIKAVKHLQKNLLIYLNSTNPYIRAEYDNMRLLIGRILREIAAVRDGRAEAVTILSLDDAKLLLAENDIVANGTLDRLIRERRITPQMATSLMNDSGYCHDACEDLIEMARILFAERDPSIKAAERSVALDEAEIEQMASGQNTSSASR